MQKRRALQLSNCGAEYPRPNNNPLTSLILEMTIESSHLCLIITCCRNYTTPHTYAPSPTNSAYDAPPNFRNAMIPRQGQSLPPPSAPFQQHRPSYAASFISNRSGNEARSLSSAELGHDDRVTSAEEAIHDEIAEIKRYEVRCFLWEGMS